MSISTSSLTSELVALWVHAAKAGEQSAFTHLYRRFVPLVHGILLGRFRPALADELTQECFATAFARLDQLQEVSRFGAWISTMARRIRPSTVLEQTVDDTALIELEFVSSLEDQLEAQQMLARILRLPESYRETLLLRFVEGLTGPEIADITGLTPESVRVNLHRGMEKLRLIVGVAREASLSEQKGAR